MDYKICQLLINLDFEKILEDEKKRKKLKKWRRCDRWVYFNDEWLHVAIGSAFTDGRPCKKSNRWLDRNCKLRARRLWLYIAGAMGAVRGRSSD